MGLGVGFFRATSGSTGRRGFIRSGFTFDFWPFGGPDGGPEGEALILGIKWQRFWRGGEGCTGPGICSEDVSVSVGRAEAGAAR